VRRGLRVLSRVDPKRLALAGIVGPAAFALAAVIGGLTKSGYSPVHEYVSALAATGSSVRTLMTIGFFALGIGILVFAVAVRRLRPAAVLLALVLTVSGVGTLTAGTFSCDPGCPTKGDITTHQQLHNVSSVFTFSSWIIAPFVAARQLRRARFARISLVFGVVELAFGLVLGSYADASPGDPVGLLQRIELVAVGAWFVLFALELRRPSVTP